MAVTDKKEHAFHELEVIRIEAKKYLPDDFDPDKELEEARTDRIFCLVSFWTIGARTDRYSVVDFGKEDGRNGYDQP